jgi:hypothetical protein
MANSEKLRDVEGEKSLLIESDPSLLRTIDKLISQPDNDSKAN